MLDGLHGNVQRLRESEQDTKNNHNEGSEQQLHDCSEPPMMQRYHLPLSGIVRYSHEVGAPPRLKAGLVQQDPGWLCKDNIELTSVC